jgi:serine/threonine protein kinase
MAPEQVQGEPPSKASDLYALAAIAHEMLTGQHYLDLRGKGDFEIREAIVRGAPSTDLGRVPTGLRAWLARGLSKHAEDRWPDAAGAGAALRNAPKGP